MFRIGDRVCVCYYPFHRYVVKGFTDTQKQYLILHNTSGTITAARYDVRRVIATFGGDYYVPRF